MATKRSYTEANRQRQGFDGSHRKKRRRAKFEEATNDQEHSRRINPLKTRIRDLRRLLQRAENLPADVKIGYERELASHQHDVERLQEEKRRSEMIRKYHMVRFFDRQKATRRLKKVRKDFADNEDPEKVPTLKQRLHTAEVDVNYAMYYPLDQIYISLYPKSSAKDEESQDANGGFPGRREGNKSLWEAVEKAMENGTLDALRNGRSMPKRQQPASVTKPSSEKVKQGQRQKTTKPNSKSRAVADRSKVEELKGLDEDELDEQSDDDFFEK